MENPMTTHSITAPAALQHTPAQRMVAGTRQRIAAFAIVAVGATACLIPGAAAFAQGGTSAAVTTTTGDPYKACRDGTSNEDRTTCMKEAAAAKAELQRGQLTNATPAGHDQNALQRCDVLPSGQKEDCRLRILGAGTTSGSVAGGGVLREVTTQVPAAPPAMTGTAGERAPAADPMPMAMPMPMPMPMPMQAPMQAPAPMPAPR
jgi:hypothetical protein